MIQKDILTYYKHQMVTIPKMDGITMDQVILLLIKILEFWKQSAEWVFFGIVKKKYKNFILELDYKTSEQKANSGIFLRVPEIPISDNYIYNTFEIQICDAAEDDSKTAAVYLASAASKDVSNPPGEWNHYKIAFIEDRITVELNGELVNDWKAVPKGKVKDFSDEGYIGIQNHDWDTTVSFKNILIKEL